MTLTTEQLRARAKFWREKAVEAKWESVSIAQDMLLNADAFEELAANREEQPVGYFVRHRSVWDKEIMWKPWTECSAEDYAEYCKRIATGEADAGRFYDARILYDAPPAPANARAVAWEIRYWNSGHNMWHDWERITAEQHAEMSVQHAADNDYEFRILYDAPPAPAVVKPLTEFYSNEGIVVRLEQVMAALALIGVKYERKGDACRAAMLENIGKPAPQLDSVVTRHADKPVSGGYKLPPHVYRELVNSLRDTAVKFSGTEQLRERLNTALSQFIEPDHPHTRTVAPEGGN
ncbi:TPA: hypothetical protein ACIKT7_000627 [Serratia marcescens]